MRSSQAGVTDLASRHVTPEGGVDSGLGERAVKRGSCQMSPDLSRAPRRVGIVHVQNLTVPPRPHGHTCIIHQALLVGQLVCRGQHRDVYNILTTVDNNDLKPKSL